MWITWLRYPTVSDWRSLVCFYIALWTRFYMCMRILVLSAFLPLTENRAHLFELRNLGHYWTTFQLFSYCIVNESNNPNVFGKYL